MKVSDSVDLAHLNEAEAFSWDSAPRYLFNDRDSTYGDAFWQRVQGMAIREIMTAPRSPWQSCACQNLRPD
jgi:hypothetical protein